VRLKIESGNHAKPGPNVAERVRTQSGEETAVVVHGDSSDEGPPPSTAPPAMGRGKRARAHTARCEDAVNAGITGTGI